MHAHVSSSTGVCAQHSLYQACGAKTRTTSKLAIRRRRPTHKTTSLPVSPFAQSLNLPRYDTLTKSFEGPLCARRPGLHRRRARPRSRQHRLSEHDGETDRPGRSDQGLQRSSGFRARSQVRRAGRPRREFAPPNRHRERAAQTAPLVSLAFVFFSPPLTSRSCSRFF